jgi:hypothetical protein
MLAKLLAFSSSRWHNRALTTIGKTSGQNHGQQRAPELPLGGRLNAFLSANLRPALREPRIVREGAF